MIHRIGYSPFFVHYWSSHQRNIYNTYASREFATVSIDATGGCIQKISRKTDEPSGPIFIYLMVINCSAGQFSVSQMISERHTTEDIAFWLSGFEHSGAIRPKVVAVDGSEALMNACARVYANADTIYDYSEHCANTTPICWIRYDVAHFIKCWATFLTGQATNRKLRVFFLATVGRLIRCTNKDDAEGIIRAIFIVSYPETSGHLPTGQKTMCAIETSYLNDLITSKFN